MARGRTRSVLIRRHDGDRLGRHPDRLLVEEPLEIRLDGERVATTMRTPGHDYELAVGFCFAEGLLGGAEVRSVRYCATGSAVATEFNIVTVETDGTAPPPTSRLGTTTSSCGWCGSEEIDDLAVRLKPLPSHEPIPVDVLAAVPDLVRPHQELFEETGGSHAAALFDRDGEIRLVREDIGRHNAVDKVIGRMLLEDRLPAAGLGLFVSGRTSFEIVQKAWAAGFGTIVAVSAASSLAVEAARRARIDLCGFARPGRLNLYNEAVPAADPVPPPDPHVPADRPIGPKEPSGADPSA